MPRLHALTPSLAELNVRTMPVTIASADLRNMTEEERARVIGEAMQAAPDDLENYLLVLDSRLREFEHRYELSTSELHDELMSGRRRETADIAKWLFWAQLRSDLVARKARP